MPLNVAIVSREHDPDRGGGIGSSVRHVVPALAEAGCHVHVITDTNPARAPRLAIDGRITVHRVPMGDGSGAGAVRGSLEAARVVARLVRDRRADVVEFADYEAAGLATALRRTFGPVAAAPSPPGGVPAIVVHLHSPLELNLALNGITDAAVPSHLALLIVAERWCLGHADLACAPSRWMADWASAHFALPAAPVVVPYAHGRLRPPAAPAAPATLLYTGRLERRKGVDLLARAWNRLAPRHPQWRLRLVGGDTATGPGGGSMRAHVRDLLDPVAAERTDLVDHRPPEALAEEYDRAAMCVVPSRWENYPNTCLEAMGAGRPVVVSAAGGMREMLGTSGGGHVFTAGDVADLERVLQFALDEPAARRAARGAAARARIETNNAPAAVAAARIDLYRAALRNARAPGARSSRSRPLDLWRCVQRAAAGGPPFIHLPAVAPDTPDVPVLLETTA